MAITPITNNITPPPVISLTGTGAAQSPAGSFQSVFKDALSQVDSLQTQAHQKVSDFLSGEGAEVHEVAMATQKAELAFEMFQQVRNKVLSAYQEVMRTQL